MDRVVKLVAYPPKLEKAKRVAAYARVSCGKDARRCAYWSVHGKEKCTLFRGIHSTQLPV